MGLCGSKYSKSEKPLTSKPSGATVIVTDRTGKPNLAQNNDIIQQKETLSPRDAARKAAEEREERIKAESSKTKLSQQLAQERAKSRKAHIMEIARS